MRQVNRDELIYRLAAAWRHVPMSVRKQLADPRAQQRERAEAAAGAVMADALGRYEIMIDAPAVADTFFAQPLATMRGERGGDGAPKLDGE